MTWLQYDVEVDLGELDHKIDRAAARRAEGLVAESLLADCEPYVPVRTGALRDSGTVRGNEVSWTEEYASYVHDGTARMMARPWTLYAVGANMRRYEDIVREELT